ncbi:MAG: zf-HC2 domain-containing protein [Acidobacteria bacterium]|nr:zf-HC2 domain-containing protein [Acidobacteriota bacterium]
MATKRTTCDMLTERLSAFLDGDLTAAECARIQRHAKTCARCTKLTDELQRTVGMCQRAAKAPLPPALRARARARIKTLLKERA